MGNTPTNNPPIQTGQFKNIIPRDIERKRSYTLKTSFKLVPFL